MEMIAAALLGLVSGFISALSTGGGMVMIPGLLFMGLSPVEAIATSRLGLISSAVSSSYEYYKGKAISWRYMPYFLILAVVAGVVGPQILLNLDQDLVQKLIAIVMLALLPLLILQSDLGVKNHKYSRRRRIVGLFLMFVVLLYSAMFGAGAGILFMYVLVYMFGMKVVQANATYAVVALVSSSVALASYIHSGSVAYHLAIPLIIGSLVGGYIGANTALKKGSAWVKWILVAVILLSSLKLLL